MSFDHFAVSVQPQCTHSCVWRWYSTISIGRSTNQCDLLDFNVERFVKKVRASTAVDILLDVKFQFGLHVRIPYVLFLRVQVVHRVFVLVFHLPQPVEVFGSRFFWAGHSTAVSMWFCYPHWGFLWVALFEAWSVLTISTSCSFDNWLSSSSLWCLDVRLFMCVIFSPRCTLCQVPPPESLREGDDKNLCIFFLLLANLIGIGRAVAKASNLTFLTDCSRIIKILSKMYSARLSWLFRCVW